MSVVEVDVGRQDYLKPMEPISDDEDDVADPRIQTELDQLNFASTEINRLENELNEARTKYRSIVSTTSSEMEVIAHEQKRSIRKAREYYKVLVDSKLAQGELVKAVRQYQSAVSVYKAAKETVALAENKLCGECGEAATATLSSAWQEMLNHALSKVTEAEKERARCEENHKKRAAKFAKFESQKQLLEKKYAKSIRKARPYFQLKEEMDVKLKQQKQNVQDLQAAIRCNKAKYTDSLRKLETISEEIHQIRREKLWSKIPRMPGVGADADSNRGSASDLDLVSLTSGRTCSTEGGSMSDDEDDVDNLDGINLDRDFVLMTVNEDPDGEENNPIADEFRERNDTICEGNSDSNDKTDAKDIETIDEGLKSMTDTICEGNSDNNDTTDAKDIETVDKDSKTRTKTICDMINGNKDKTYTKEIETVENSRTRNDTTYEVHSDNKDKSNNDEKETEEATCDSKTDNDKTKPGDKDNDTVDTFRIQNDTPKNVANDKDRPDDTNTPGSEKARGLDDTLCGGTDDASTNSKTIAKLDKDTPDDFSGPFSVAITDGANRLGTKPENEVNVLDEKPNESETSDNKTSTEYNQTPSNELGDYAGLEISEMDRLSPAGEE